MFHNRQIALVLLAVSGLCSTGVLSAQSDDQQTQPAAEASTEAGIKVIRPPHGYSPSDAREAVRAKLRQRVRMHLDGVSLTDFLQILEEALGCPVTLDHVELALIGVDPETTFLDASFEGKQIGTALRTLLRKHDCGYYLDDGLVVITSRDKAQDQVFTRVYDCADLLQADRALLRALERPQAPESAEEAGDDAIEANTADAGFVSQTDPYFHGPRPPLVLPELDLSEWTSEDQLIHVVTGVPDYRREGGWRADGTGEGTINMFAGKLIVSQTLDVHDEIEFLLNSLRSGRAGSADDAIQDAR